MMTCVWCGSEFLIRAPRGHKSGREGKGRVNPNEGDEDGTLTKSFEAKMKEEWAKLLSRPRRQEEERAKEGSAHWEVFQLQDEVKELRGFFKQ